jgi:hypothetical protein
LTSPFTVGDEVKVNGGVQVQVQVQVKVNVKVGSSCAKGLPRVLSSVAMY